VNLYEFAKNREGLGEEHPKEQEEVVVPVFSLDCKTDRTRGGWTKETGVLSP